ncbi:MAG TPA: SLC13 family permease [Flavobacteriales bacterium]|nr:SLC13 family permease [Flavobacteriales bacterium]
MISFSMALVFAVIIFLLVALYSGKLRAEVSFFIAVTVLIIAGVLSPSEALAGFANEQLAVIMLLLVISDIIRKTDVINLVFNQLFRGTKTVSGFVFRMVAFVAPTSAFFNNTPLVAMMMPYVYSWSKKNKISPSKLLIPLSYAAILGGCMTLVGTSTNLVVNGMAVDAGFNSLNIFDFAWVGFPMVLVGGIYLALFSDKILPSHKDAMDDFKDGWREYFVETEIEANSPIVGKSVSEAGLRNLSGNFLVEIIRKTAVITPVSPEHILRANDKLIFTGETSSIPELSKPELGLSLPKECIASELSDVVEVVVSHNSWLIGRRVKNTHFRGKYDAAIVAIHRNGAKISGKIGSVVIQAGDVLLLFAGRDFDIRATGNEFYVISKKENKKVDAKKAVMVIAGVLLSVVVSANTALSLFSCLLVVLAISFFTKTLTGSEIKRGINLNMMLIMAFGLALGKAMSNSGAAEFIANNILKVAEPFGPVAILGMVFLVTNLLASYMTNLAAVAIIFPISVGIAQSMNLPLEPFIMIVAFGGAANFITPIGYQTNLMVYGSGGYSFNDFMKIGLPLTILYIVIGTLLMSWRYGLM